MELVNLLERADSAGLTLEARGDRLIVTGPEEAEPIVRELSEHKAEVLDALRARTASRPNYSTVKEVKVHKAAPQFHGVTTDQPAKVVLGGIDHYVAVEAGMWFFDRGGGWTCAGDALAERIERELG
jgi:hypothetical protein